MQSQKATKAVTPAKAGVQKCLFFLDSGFRRNDRKCHFLAFYETINLKSKIRISPAFAEATTRRQVLRISLWCNQV